MREEVVGSWETRLDQKARGSSRVGWQLPPATWQKLAHAQSPIVIIGSYSLGTDSPRM
jgi:hypothetical protein